MDGAYEYKTARSHPSQARGKERVRVILSAALKLFAERGLESVTTNDIARAAGIPIGSLYRYYPNKDAVVVALVELYAADLSEIFNRISKHPLFENLSWNEILLLIVDAWVAYVRLNGGFPLLYAERIIPRLHAQNKNTWEALIGSFAAVMRGRCGRTSDKEALLCFQFCFMTAMMSVLNEEHESILGANPHYDGVEIIAAYMNKACLAHEHDR